MRSALRQEGSLFSSPAEPRKAAHSPERGVTCSRSLVRGGVVYDLHHGLLAAGLEVCPLHMSLHHHRQRLERVGAGLESPPRVLTPQDPSLSPSQSLDRSSCPSPQLRKASASKKLLRRKHFVYWFRLLIRVDSCIDLNSPGREETGQETFPRAMPCLSERI